jgi:hypothetical protein
VKKAWSLSARLVRCSVLFFPYQSSRVEGGRGRKSTRYAEDVRCGNASVSGSRTRPAAGAYRPVSNKGGVTIEYLLIPEVGSMIRKHF